MSNRRLTKRQKRARARRRQQIMVRVLILIIAAVCIISFAVNRGKPDSRKDTVSADTENVSADALTQSEQAAGSEESASSASSAGTEAAASSASSEEPEGSVSSEPSPAPGETGTDVNTETGEDSSSAGEPETESSWLDSDYGTQDTNTAAYALNQTVEEAKERQALLNLNDDELAEALYERNVPDELVEFMQEYPETREFVVDYLFQPDVKPSMDISGEVTKGVIPHFLQWDQRWGYDMYGDSTMAVSACGPTAMSEVYSGLTGKTDMNPYEMAQWAQERGYHVSGAGTSWEMMSGGARKLGLEVWSVSSTESAILETLRDGYPIICAMAPGDFTYFGHFIVLVSVDSNGNISIRDSNSNIRTQRTWTCDELLWQINEMWAYSYESYQPSED